MEQTWDGIDRRAAPSLDELEDISHHIIYHRITTIERKIDRNENATKEVVAAFDSAKAAFHVLEMIGKVAKPLFWLGSIITAIGVAWTEFRR